MWMCEVRGPAGNTHAKRNSAARNTDPGQCSDKKAQPSNKCFICIYFCWIMALFRFFTPILLSSSMIVWQKCLQGLAALMLAGVPSVTLASGTETVGDILSVLLPAAGITTATAKHDRDGQLQFLESIATNAVLTFGLKSAIDKSRPDGECCDSFPSSHSSYAFMGATFLERRYGRKYAIAAYTAATFVAYSRVAADRHYIEDVVAGAAIGYLSSRLFTSRFHGLTVSAIVDHDFAGISFSKTW
jgi:membrane-associated phospholipid phosphatase